MVVTPSCRFQRAPDGPGTPGSAEVTSAPKVESRLICGRTLVVPCCATLRIGSFQSGWYWISPLFFPFLLRNAWPASSRIGVRVAHPFEFG